MTRDEWNASTHPAKMLAYLVPPIRSHGSGWSRTQTQQLPKVSDRKLRLIACACCRSVWHLLTDPRSRNAVGVAEKYADDAETFGTVQEARLDAMDERATGTAEYLQLAVWEVCTTPSINAARAIRHLQRAGAEASTQADLIRDIVGDPWRPVESVSLDWVQRMLYQKSVQYALAERAYAERVKVRCERCGGRGSFDIGLRGGHEDDLKQYIYPPPTEMPCEECHGTGTIDSGQLNPTLLLILADALENAGCTDAAILEHLRGPGAHVRGCWVIDLLLGKG